MSYRSWFTEKWSIFVLVERRGIKISQIIVALRKKKAHKNIWKNGHLRNLEYAATKTYFFWQSTYKSNIARKVSRNDGDYDRMKMAQTSTLFSGARTRDSWAEICAFFIL
mgnify:CR=1 FL=1